MMRPVREITAEEERFRIERIGVFDTIRRDPVKPEPEGTIIVMAFRVIGYAPDCDGSLMARVESIDKNGESTGWDATGIGLYPDADLVVSLDEWRRMFGEAAEAAKDGA